MFKLTLFYKYKVQKAKKNVKLDIKRAKGIHKNMTQRRQELLHTRMVHQVILKCCLSCFVHVLKKGLRKNKIKKITESLYFF